MSCLLCGEKIHYDLRWQMIWNFRKIEVDCLCQKCQATFKCYSPKSEDCSGCGRPLNGEDPFLTAHYVEKGAYCYDCYRWLKQYSSDMVKHTALLVYSDNVREWLYQYKYRADARLAQVVAPYLRTFYKAHSEAEWLVLPSSPKSMAERGFHATGYLLDCAGIPYSCPFEYVGDGCKQARKNRQERLALTQPFSLDETKLITLQSKNWLIFDDVYTTGATLLKAKELLRPYLSKENHLFSLSVARDVLR